MKIVIKRFKNSESHKKNINSLCLKMGKGHEKAILNREIINSIYIKMFIFPGNWK